MLLVGVLSMSTLNAQKLSFDEIKSIAQKLNAMYPIMVDSETRWDGFNTMQQDDSTVVVQYTYTLVNISVLNVSTSRLEDFKVEQEKKLVKLVKGNDALSIFRENNFSFTFLYYDKDKKVFAIFKITPEKYNNPYPTGTGLQTQDQLHTIKM